MQRTLVSAGWHAYRSAAGNSLVAGQPKLLKIVIYAASTAKERPFDLLRTAVKRAVAEIQTQPETANTASASAPAIQTREVH